MGLAEQLDELRREISELKRRIGSMDREGVIAEVSPDGGSARVQLTDGPSPMLSGWIPREEASAGANKTHNPMTVGQLVKVSSATGDLHDAVVRGSLNSDANARPSSKGDEVVLLSVGAASIKATGGGSAIVFKVGGYTLTLSAAGAVNTGGALSHNGKNIGDTHTHKGVTAGPSNTGTPN